MIGKFSKDVEEEIQEKGFHVLKKSFAKRNMYPNRFPDFGDINEIEIGESYVVRLFVDTTFNNVEKIDSGLIDVRILAKENDTYSCEILTLLPYQFPLKKGDKVILTKDELLYKQK
jgi:hypothetical protein